MFVVDTNVLVYAVHTGSPAYAQCRGLLESWRHQSSAWFVTWGILYEFLRVSTHAHATEKPMSLTSAWGFVDALLASSALGVLTPTSRHRVVLAEVLGQVPEVRGNIIHDVHTAVLMREHGVRRIYTRDVHFHRFPSLEVLDPLA